jgi:hypothetical protein
MFRNNYPELYGLRGKAYPGKEKLRFEAPQPRRDYLSTRHARKLSGSKFSYFKSFPKNRRNGKVGGGTPKLIQVVPCPIGGP